MDIDTKMLWNEISESVRVSVSSAIFSTWFSQTYISELKKTGSRYLAEIGCSSSYVKSTLELRYYGLIQDLLTKSLNYPCDLSFVVKQKIREKEDVSIIAPLFQEHKDDSVVENAMVGAKLRLNFTFKNFAVSSSNQMAWAAAEAVSKTPGSAYNPLFIWGGVGVGKTHLMNAVGYSVVKKDGSAKVFFCSGEEFTNDIVEGIRNKTTQVFRDKYRRLDVLMVDDIQFIAGKDAVQEEFFHTFNAVTIAGGQVILTSDRPPSEISKLEERLKSRFEAGLIVDITPPDFELRCAITQIKAKERGMEVPMDLVQVIAANIDSARRIEGFLVKLASQARLKKTEISEELVNSLIGKGDETAQKVKARPIEVISAVSKHYAICKKSLLGSSRVRQVARPRQILMYLLRRELGLPLEEVGRLVGGRDHTTVMHAVEKISHLASEDEHIRGDLRGIKNSL